MNTVLSDDMLLCQICDRQLHRTARACPGCGAVQPRRSGAGTDAVLILPTGLLCFFFGWLGAHRFYVGKVGTGLLQLVTIGGLGLWAFIDLILILTGVFKDGDGKKITQWV
jgi:hypothetical protein